MSRWKKDAKEFTVSVNFHKDRGYQSSIPRPILEVLGTPRRIKFVIEGRMIKVLGVKT